ncbi:MAG TPA: NADP-dependent malic enzyme [Spirochaetia bacterium]|nr:NADP-dependent malic enzyme [Spirochaetales bacterium]HRW25652.1 NADP-dependent malic enzyme [Spirochaetia bacterium]
MSLRDDALKLHKDHAGKLEIRSTVPLRDKADLSLAYTPGVAEPCLEIAARPDAVYEYCGKGNLVAVVSDGSAVLGLGDIGPAAAIPVMEGKAALFKAFGGVDAFPICLGTKDVDELVDTIARLEPVFGGVNLEDISAPRCFEVEARLKERMAIPVFHDDQHGTAIVLLAGLLNALKLVGKTMGELVVAINGAGSAGIAIARMLLAAGAGDVILSDIRGILRDGDESGLNRAQAEIAALTNRDKRRGALADAMRGSDVFIGVSRANLVTRAMVRGMARDPIVFAMANPVPEIDPDEALAAGARVVGTGRSDRPNQVNNVLAFPGVFRGALDARASDIDEAMKLAAAYAIAGVVPDGELREDYILPTPFDPRVAPAVARAVAKAAIDAGLARVAADPDAIAERMAAYLARTRSSGS